MKLSRPKSPKSNPNLFYVSSESGGDKHIVVKLGNLYFCDCKNFTVNRLPKLGTSEFAFCKHGSFASKVIESTPTGVELIEATKLSGDSDFIASGKSVNPLVANYEKQKALLTKSLPQPQPKKYEIRLLGKDNTVDLGRSYDLNGEYKSIAEAKRVIHNHTFRTNAPGHGLKYKVQPL